MFHLKILEWYNNSGMNLNSNDNLSFLHCLICYKKVRRARMCPYCSKLGCYDCLSSWSSKQTQCPNCRTHLGLADYADCERFVEEVKQQLKIKNSSEFQSEKDLCSTHSLRKRYYCQQCEDAFCPDCSAFTGTHQGHQIKLLSQIYEDERQKIQRQILKFDAKIQEYKAKELNSKIELQKLAQAKNHRMNFIQNYIYTKLGQLEAQAKQKESLVLSRFQANQQQIQLLQNIKDTILDDLDNYSQNQVISRTEEILHLIKSLCEKDIEQVQIDTNFLTVSELVPEYQSFTYVLSNFSTLGEAVIYSQGYHFNGCQWRMKVYPRGNGVAKGRFISVFLEMTKGISTKIKYQYKIELIHHLNFMQTMPREYSSQFQIGECWGYNQFIELKTLEQGYLAEDQLTFRFYLRNPTYRDLVVQQKKHIQNLQVRLKELQRTLVCDMHNSSPIMGQNVMKQMLQGIAMKEVGNKLVVNSIQNQALDMSYNRMSQKQAPIQEM